jgi:hypothetical protein
MRYGILGPTSFDANGDLTAPPVTILRIDSRSTNDEPGAEQSLVNRVIRVPAAAIG